jgi:hypothetical protein
MSTAFRILVVVAALALTLAACGGSSPAPAGDGAPASPASGNSNASQIVITGAIDKTYAPVKVEAGTLANNIAISVNEAEVGGVTIQFPADTQPGTYPIGDHLHKPVVDVLAEYDVFGNNAAFYLSTKGTLTLTATGDKFSGTFQFTAGYNKDESKIINVAGAFVDVPLAK